MDEDEVLVVELRNINKMKLKIEKLEDNEIIKISDDGYISEYRVLKDIKKIHKILFSESFNYVYSNDAKFGFYNIDYYLDYNHPYSEKTKLIKRDDISFLQGASGILLSLLPFIKPIKTNWMRHLLIN